PTELKQLSSRSIDIPLRDFAALEDRLDAQISEMLNLTLKPGDRAALREGATTSSTALQAYMQGRGHLYRYEKQDNVQAAIESFTASVKADPKYPLAHSALCEAYWRSFENTKDIQWIPRAKDSCAFAIAGGDKLAPVHVTLAMIANGTGQFEQSVQEASR